MQIPESLLLRNDLDIQGILKQFALYLVSVETETHVFEESGRREQAGKEGSEPAGGMMAPGGLRRLLGEEPSAAGLRVAESGDGTVVFLEKVAQEKTRARKAGSA